MEVRPFVDRLIAYGALPPPKEYFVDWPDLGAPTDSEKAEVAKNKTEAFAKYVGGNVDGLIAPKEFLMMIMDMSEDEADAIEKGVAEYIKKVDEDEIKLAKKLKRKGLDVTPTGGLPKAEETPTEE